MKGAVYLGTVDLRRRARLWRLVLRMARRVVCWRLGHAHPVMYHYYDQPLPEPGRFYEHEPKYPFPNQGFTLCSYCHAELSRWTLTSVDVRVTTHSGTYAVEVEDTITAGGIHLTSVTFRPRGKDVDYNAPVLK